MVTDAFHALPLSKSQLSLAVVLRCGQSFRWSIYPLSSSCSDTSVLQPTHEYRLCLKDRLVCLRQSSDTLFYRAVFPDSQQTATQIALRDAETLVWLKDYFQLDVDLEKLYDTWSAQDAVFATFKDRFGGIRMLRQDPWENLLSFICSSNNNISRITNMVQNLCKHYSPPLLSLAQPDSTETKTYYPFPPPSVLAEDSVRTTLRTLGFGYRAGFVQRTARMLFQTHGSSALPNDPSEASERWLKGLRSKSTADARQELLQFIGVGRKVADCVLLMSLDKKEVIPVDTHVHQIAIKYYGLKASSKVKINMTPKLYEEMNLKFLSIWGDYAGWAHSVLFTADLKSFASYGVLPTSPSTRKTQRNTGKKDTATSHVPSLPSPSKRKKEPSPEADPAGLAERVKRRRSHQND